ncbi:unnamed protein product [Lathyrus sativus]|nr:unnamed protein product [Lathyrus sativus]
MGSANNNLNEINIVAIKEGPRLSNEHMRMLEMPVTEAKFTQALNSIGDLKAPGVDGYGAKFFKETWSIVKEDVVKAIMEFFNQNKMYPTINATLVSLIPNGNSGKTIKDFHPISGCTTIYKISVKILVRPLRSRRASW